MQVDRFAGHQPRAVLVNIKNIRLQSAIIYLIAEIGYTRKVKNSFRRSGTDAIQGNQTAINKSTSQRARRYFYCTVIKQHMQLTNVLLAITT